MAEPAPVGLAGPTALRRPDQLAVGADRFRLRTLIGGHRRLRGDRGPGADSTGTAGRVPAGPATAGHRPVPHAVRAALDLCTAGDRGDVALDSGAHRRRDQHCARTPHRMAHRSRPRASCGFGRRGVDQRRICLVVLPSRINGDSAGIHNAARTDGASAWQRFWRITLPMLRPTMFFVLVTGIISAAQVFDTVYALTGGGPQGSTDLVAHRIYAEAFGAAAIGRASVMAVVLFVILVGATVVQHLYFRRRISYELT